MSLKHIMLGILREPNSGYDIKKRFEHSLSSFWKAELSQIYPLLQKMETDGLLTSKAGTSDIGPTRKVYKRSEKGRRELRNWLGNGPTVGTERIGYLAQVFFLANLNDDDKAIEFIEELRTYLQESLTKLEQTEEEWSSNNPGYPDQLSDIEFYPQLALDFGLVRLRTSVDWCDRCIERISGRKSTAQDAQIASGVD